MRIEVDVYKGPLSNTVPIQKGQLGIIIGSARTALEDVDGQLATSMCRLECYALPSNIKPDHVTKNIYKEFQGKYESQQDENDKKKYKKNYEPFTYEKNYEPFTYEDVIENRNKNYSKYYNKFYDADRNPKKSPNVHQGPPTFGALPSYDNSDAYPQIKKDALTPDAHQCAQMRTPPRPRSAANYVHKDRRFYSCDIYVRMRHQMQNVKWAVDGYRHRYVNNAFTPVNTSTDISLVITKLSQKPILVDQNICDTGKKGAKSCKMELRAIQSGLDTISDALKKIKDQTDQDLRVPIGSPEMNLAYMSKLTSSRNALEAGIDSITKSLENLKTLQKTTEKPDAITELVRMLKESKDKIAAHNNEKNLHQAIVKQHGQLVALPAINDSQTAENVHIAVRAIGDSATNSHTNLTAIKMDIGKLRNIYNQSTSETLKAYLANKKTSSVKLIKTETDAELLSQRLNNLREITTAIEGDIKPLTKQYKNKKQQEVEKKKIEQALANVTFSVLAATASDTDVKAEIKKTSDQLDQTNKLIKDASKINGWDTPDLFKPLTDKTQAVQTTLGKATNNEVNFRKDAQGNDSSDELKELEKNLKALLPSLLPSIIDVDAGKLLNIQHRRLAIKALMEGRGNIALAGDVKDMKISNASLNALANETTGYMSNFKTEAALPSEIQAFIDEISADIHTSETEALGKQVNTSIGTLNSKVSEIKAVNNTLKDILKEHNSAQAIHESKGYSDIAAIAGSFRLLATTISFQIASVAPRDKRLLIDMAKVANLGAELSNQLTSRANALNIQIGDGKNIGLDRSVISTGQYLRNTKPTAFLDSYDWLQASTNGRTSPQDRIRVAKRLFDDDNWSRVNEVYASGAGDTSMAFIRDEIGNWNLKSFDNDPTALTAAYTDLTLGLIEKAAKVAASTATGGAGLVKEATDSANAISQLNAQANAAQTGQTSNDARTGSLLAGINMEAFRKEIIDNMDKAFEARQTSLAKIEKYKKENIDQTLIDGTAKDDLLKDGQPICKNEQPPDGQPPSTKFVNTETKVKFESEALCNKDILKKKYESELSKANEAAQAAILRETTRYADFILALQTVAAEETN